MSRNLPHDFTRENEDEVLPLLRGGATFPPRHRPQTEMQALMEADLGDEPEVSMEELEKLGDTLAYAIERLSYPLRYIVDATIIERRALSSFTFGEVFGLDHARADERMSKSYAVKLRNKALAELREWLSNDPDVTRWLD
jgi:hypothetical protein